MNVKKYFNIFYKKYLKVFLHINNATSISLNGFELHHPFCSQNGKIIILYILL